MRNRLIERYLHDQLRHYPAIALVGSRQAGKTTLAEKISSYYFDLEQESDRIRLEARWSELMNSKECLVFDEAQSLSASFS